MWYNQHKRKPFLRIKILELLAVKGKLSKTKAERILDVERINNKLETKTHYNEIHEAFESLKDIKLITLLPSVNQKKEIFYEITNQGLQAIICDKPNPKKFWTFILGYCYHKHTLTTINEMVDFYDFFMHRFLKYPSVKGISFIVLSFVMMYSKWVEGKNDRIELRTGQKLMEILALKGPLELKDLVHEVNEPVDAVNNVLYEFATDAYYYAGTPEFTIYGLEKDESRRDPFINFLQHSLILVKYNKAGTKTFELSLFGLFFILAILRHNRKDFISNFNPSPYVEFVDNVTTRFESKLPLIFGKWVTLKKYLKVWAAYNFDIALDEKVLMIAREQSVTLHGNKEIYESIASMVSFNNSQRVKVFKSGLESLASFKRNNVEYLVEPYKRKQVDDTQVEVVNKLLWGTIFDRIKYETEFLHYFIPEDLQATEVQNENLYKIESLVQILEGYFANEITVSYYLNLNSESYRSGIKPNAGTIEMFVQNNTAGPQRLREKNTNTSVLPLSPKDRFRTILEKDKEIREFISTVLNDVFDYQKSVSLELGSLYHDLGLT